MKGQVHGLFCGGPRDKKCWLVFLCLLVGGSWCFLRFPNAAAWPIVCGGKHTLPSAEDEVVTSVWSCVEGGMVSFVWRVSVPVTEGEAVCEEEVCFFLCE